VTAIAVNGVPQVLDPGTDGTLLWWLRGSLGLTSPKPACGEGVCGACTVLLDGAPVPSCQTPVLDAVGHTITTVEGLAADGHLHPVQEAVLEEGAAQCGYCTPAMVLRAVALLAVDPHPDEHAIGAALDPNLCRCGCYARIVRAVRGAAGRPTTRRAPMPSGGEQAGGEQAGGEQAGDEWVGDEWAGDEQKRHPAAEEPPVESAVAIPWDLAPLGERDYAGVLGPGAVWVVEADAGGWPRSGGAWLHVGPSGVTAFSGKVDVGQDNHTALRMVVAEELSVPLDSVRLVLGDTDLCPYDVGTFGSRSMLEAAQALRRAAAGAGEGLRSRAAARWAVDAGGLTAAEGAVSGGPGGERLTYQELVSGGCSVEVVAGEVPVRQPGDRRVMGRPHAPSRIELVTGLRRFVSDLHRPGMVYGAVLRPPAYDARLVALDTRRAEAVPGVTVVTDGSFVGVLAGDPAAARRALGLVEAGYEHAETKIPDLSAHLRAHPVEGVGWEGPVDVSSGDTEAALHGAAHVVRATYTTAYLAHTPLETRAALAEWDDGRLTVWTGTQVPFGARAHVAAAFGLDERAVRVIVPPTGGAFGGKHGGDVAVEAARLARAAGRPVLVHWSRAEEFQWGTLRPMAVIDVRAGLDERGALAAWDFLDVNAGAAALGLPYSAETHRLRFQPAASPLRQGSYRALAATANNFARESAIDELARASGEDPVAFRARLLADDRLGVVLQAAADRFRWADGPLHEAPGHRAAGHRAAGHRAAGHRAAGHRGGIGVAVGLEKGGRVATCAEVSVDDQDAVRVHRVVTAYECGTIVNPDTVANQVEGGLVMALGGALHESVGVQGGMPSVRALAEYPVPRFHDLPAIEVVLLDRPELPSAGAGETPLIALAPAIANALHAATGRRLRHLPLAPGGRLP
jgi:CO/xanthine dehydrogenase Mo-binding subunit/aerobic-type carbon monoxide dehydrogenase small subunit (CoxS/CutS family)